MDLQAYRLSESERARTNDLLRILPRGRTSVLDVGARDGHFSKLLTGYYERVVALDLMAPSCSSPGISAVIGDITRLPFSDRSFDCVFCAEVLEHLVQLEQACAEIARVTRHDVVVGVPYKEDPRVGRTTCQTCGGRNPPWGHVNTFDERRLARLFPGWRVVSLSLVARRRETTTALAAALMDAAGNPWGTYAQTEPCIHCGAKLVLPRLPAPFWSRVCSGLAGRLNLIQQRVTRAQPNWLHVVFSRFTDCVGS